FLLCYRCVRWQRVGSHTSDEVHRRRGRRPMSEEAMDRPRWGDPLDRLSAEPKQDLAQRSRDWSSPEAHNNQRGPFAEERLTGLEVCGLLVSVFIGRGMDRTVAEELVGESSPAIMLRLTENSVALDLRESDLAGAMLRGAILWHAHLEG